jgi:hypothetical protein
MSKKLVLIFLAGWLLGMVLPPSRVLNMFRGQ